MINNASKLVRYNLIIVGLIAAIILCFYGNFQLRMALSWLLAVFFVFVNGLFLIVRLKIKATTFKVFMLSTIWLFLPLILTPAVLNVEIHLKAILETMMYILFFGCLFSCVEKNKHYFFYLLKVIIFSVLIFSSFSVANYFFFSDSVIFSGFHSNPNTHASLLLFLLVNIISFSSGKILINKKTTYLIISIFSFQILLTGSSKGLLGLIIVYFLFFLFKPKKVKKIVVLIFLMLTSVVVFFTAEKSVDRLSDKIYALSDFDINRLDEKNIGNDSGKVRLFLIIDSVRIISDNWITGVGVNNGQYYLTLPFSFKNTMNTINSQNNFTEMLLNGGVVAFLLYYGPLIYIFLGSLRKPNKSSFELAIIILVVLKIFLDVGMKSYNDASHVMAVTLAYYYYYISIRQRYEN